MPDPALEGGQVVARGVNPGASAPLLLVGASARAVAESALRAGLTPHAVDLFADRDLRRIAPCARGTFEAYPDGLADLADAFPPGPVMYTGGLENHPETVARLAATRPLWGNGPDVLRRVRDPFDLHATLTAIEWPTPQVRPSLMIPPPGRWLHKSLRSSGGLGVRFAGPNERLQPDGYLQEFIDGPPMSALFATRGGRAVLLGVTEQLIGEPWLHARPFGYAGNVGPLPVGRELGAELEERASRLVSAVPLVGLWGVDFILGGRRPFAVEINPRYTAAAEVVEFGTGVPALWHLRAEYDGAVGPPRGPVRPAPAVVGKAIYFAPHSLTFPDAGPWDPDLAGEFDPWRRPGFADIPAPGERFEPGQPVITFFAEGSTPDAVRAKLRERAAELDRLWGAAP